MRAHCTRTRPRASRIADGHERADSPGGTTTMRPIFANAPCVVMTARLLKGPLRPDESGRWRVALLLGVLTGFAVSSTHLAGQSTAITAVWANDGEDKVT